MICTTQRQCLNMNTFTWIQDDNFLTNQRDEKWWEVGGGDNPLITHRVKHVLYRYFPEKWSCWCKGLPYICVLAQPTPPHILISSMSFKCLNWKRKTTYPSFIPPLPLHSPMTCKHSCYTVLIFTCAEVPIFYVFPFFSLQQLSRWILIEIATVGGV
jgi:hypothetical protein